MEQVYLYNVLILEDDLPLCELLSRRLKPLAAKCRSAESIAGAEKLFREHHPDLLILDYLLASGGTGIDFYRRLVEQGHRLPAILVTGFGQESLLTDAMRLGIRDFVPKNETLLQNLPLAVQRILDDVQRDRKFTEMERDRLTFEITAAALNAAEISCFEWDMESGETTFSPQSEALLETPIDKLQTIDAFLELVEASDRQRVRAQFEMTKKSGELSEIDLNILTPHGSRWLHMKGRAESAELPGARRFRGMFWDESEKYHQREQLRISDQENRKLAERLQLSMLEIHHRVKNSFQVVNSLLNMELRRKALLEKDDIQRVISYVQGLALIHDMLTDNSKLRAGHNELDAAQLCESLCGSLSQQVDPIVVELPPGKTPISMRVASSLSVIVTELLINALKYGEMGSIRFDLECNRGDRLAQVTVSNRISPQAKSTEAKEATYGSQTGSPLVSFLAKSDFGFDVHRVVKGDDYVVTFSFPLNQADRNR